MPNGMEKVRVAILVANGFEEEELTSPKQALEASGATCDIVSPEDSKVRSWQHDHWGSYFPVDAKLNDANVEDYSALVLPGGVINPDTLRINPVAIEFIRSFLDVGKPIAAICHGPWTLIEAGAVRDRKITSWPSLKTDLINAGAIWVDEEVVIAGDLITSRKPDDLPAFNQALIDILSKERQHAW